jgi:hypothetical protein
VLLRWVAVVALVKESTWVLLLPLLLTALILAKKSTWVQE